MSALRILLVLFDVQTAAALLWAFFTPSETGQGVFLWLSPGRLGLVAILLGLLVLSVLATLRASPSRPSAARFLSALDRWCIDQHQLTPTLIGLVLTPLALAAGALVILRTPLEYESYGLLAPDTFPLLHSAASALLPLLALVVIAMLEVAFVLAVRYRAQLSTSEAWAWDRIGGSLLLLLIAITTVFHWLVLSFQLRFFVNIPAWYWIFDPIPFGTGDIWFVLGALLLLSLSWWLLIVRRQPALGLLAAAALGVFLQFGPALMGGGSLGALRDRYFTTYHAAYVQRASSADLGLLDTVRQYETTYGTGSFTGTKPPGLMVFYTALDHLFSGYPTSLSPDARYERLANLVIWLFPLLAASTILLLYAFARRLLDDESGLVQRAVPLIYVMAPGLSLFTFFVDQALYPGVFLLGVWLIVLAIRRRSLAWALLLGAVLYLAAFFAFTMLPLYVFAGIYLVAHHWRESSGKRVQGIFVFGAAIAAGTLILHVLFVTLLNYNFLPRFQHAMNVNHNFDFYLRVGLEPVIAPEPLGVRLAQIANAAWVNNLDYAAGIGLAFYFLALAQAVRRIAAFIKGRASPGDIILFTLLLSFLVLNLVGSAQGEVPRLWLFWLPMFALLAAYELAPYAHRRPFVLLIFGLAQFITLVLTYHFQDLRM